MALVTKILGKILGTKSERDIKEVTPMIEKIKEEYKRLVPFSNDDLRNLKIGQKIIIKNK